MARQTARARLHFPVLHLQPRLRHHGNFVVTSGSVPRRCRAAARVVGPDLDLVAQSREVGGGGVVVVLPHRRAPHRLLHLAASRRQTPRAPAAAAARPPPRAGTKCTPLVGCWTGASNEEGRGRFRRGGRVSGGQQQPLGVCDPARATFADRQMALARLRRCAASAQSAALLHGPRGAGHRPRRERRGGRLRGRVGVQWGFFQVVNHGVSGRRRGGGADAPSSRCRRRRRRRSAATPATRAASSTTS